MIYLILRTAILKDKDSINENNQLYINNKIYNLNFSGISVSTSGLFAYGKHKFIYNCQDIELNKNKIQEFRKNIKS